MTTNNPVPGTVATAHSGHNFERGAIPHTLANDLGLAAKAMEAAYYHCQLGSQAREPYQAMTDSDLSRQDFSGIINHLAHANAS